MRASFAFARNPFGILDGLHHRFPGVQHRGLVSTGGILARADEAVCPVSGGNRKFLWWARPCSPRPPIRNQSALSAFGAPMRLAWVRENHRVM